MKTLKEFIKAENLSMTAKRTDYNPNMDNSDDMDHWGCTITNDPERLNDWKSPAARMDLTFSMGRGHHGIAPELEDVLDCLASDAAGYANAQDFEDWASEYGYDTDSRKAEETYNTIGEQADDLRNLLGEEAFETLLWETARL